MTPEPGAIPLHASVHRGLHIVKQASRNDKLSTEEIEDLLRNQAVALRKDGLASITPPVAPQGKGSSLKAT
jgi:hypothetical protein